MLDCCGKRRAFTQRSHDIPDKISVVVRLYRLRESKHRFRPGVSERPAQTVRCHSETHSEMDVIPGGPFAHMIHNACPADHGAVICKFRMVVCAERSDLSCRIFTGDPIGCSQTDIRTVCPACSITFAIVVVSDSVRVECHIGTFFDGFCNIIHSGSSHRIMIGFRTPVFLAECFPLVNSVLSPSEGAVIRLFIIGCAFPERHDQSDLF